MFLWQAHQPIHSKEHTYQNLGLYNKNQLPVNYTMIEVIFKIFLTDYIDFQGFITKKIQKQLLIEHKSIRLF
jgi:hypothetical protein